MKTEELIIDCDGHILEPPTCGINISSRNIASAAFMFASVTTASSTLRSIRSAQSSLSAAHLARWAGWAENRGSAQAARGYRARREKSRGWFRIPRRPEDTYMKGAAFGSMNAKERLQLLRKGRDERALLYPTIGLLWEAEFFDAELSGAYCRAYNRWIADFCRDSNGRLIPIAHLSLGDPAEAARELERAVKDGCKGAFVCPFTITRIPHGDPRHDVLFAAAQDLDVPLAIHPTFEPPPFGIHHRFDGMEWASWYADLFAAQGVQHAFATLFQYGVFERFPKLRVVVLEAQAGWIGYLLDRADAIYSGTILGSTVKLKEKPSYYFKRQCYISADPDERTIWAMAQIIGDDKFFWATDYPHPDHPGNYLEELQGMIGKMTPAARSGVLGENVARAYQLI